jgi:hypothetical protein
MKAFVVFFIAFSAHADLNNPGVWEQLELGDVDGVEVKITDLKFSGSRVEVTFENGDQTESGHLCVDQEEDKSSNEMRAQHFSHMVQTLREAKREKSLVTIGYRGPWSPCIESVKLGKPQKKTALLD